MHFLLTFLLLASSPVSPADQRAVEARLAKGAREMTPASLELGDSPDCAPYHFLVFRDAHSGERSGAAVAGEDVVLANDPEGLARFFVRTRFFEGRGAREALEVWRALAQVGKILGTEELSAVPEDERKVVHLPKLEPTASGRRVIGFLKQGEQVYRLALEISAERVESRLTTLGELMGRDEVAEAARALQSKDEIVRAAAALELGGSDDKRAIAGLMAALGDESEEVRAVAAESLGRVIRRAPSHKNSVRPALEKARIKEKSERARKSIEEALAGEKGPGPSPKGPRNP